MSTLNQSVGIPDSSFGKDAVHYFGIGDYISKRNVAHVVLEKKLNAVKAQDFMDVLNTMLSFPSMEKKKKKKKKKRKSEKGHLEKKNYLWEVEMKFLISIRSHNTVII